jgi:hypothetical protein
MKTGFSAETTMSASKNIVDRKHLEDAFSLGEANMKLEGFDSASDEVYRSLKADVLAGKIDFDQAVAVAVRSVTATRRDSAA